MMSMWKTGLTLTLCFLETTLLGGALFGWPSLVYVLQADELYINRCLHVQKPNAGESKPAINTSSSSVGFLDINTMSTIRSNSSRDTIDLRSIQNRSITIVRADTFFTTDNVTTAHILSVNTKQGETSVNADINDSDTNDNVTVRAQTVIRCKEQKVALSLSYTVATVSFGVCALPIGVFFDRFGLRMTRTITALVAVAGYCQLAFAKRGLEWMILTGAIFIGPTCYSLLITNFHVAKLAGKRIGLAIAIYAAGMNSSFAYQLVKIAHDAGVTRVVALLTLASLWLVVLFTSWCLLPKFKIEDNKLGIIKHSMFTIFGLNMGDIAKTKISPNFGGGPSMEQSLWRYITSATYITFLFWFCADYTCHNRMISGYDTWITEIVHGDMIKVTFYTDFLAYGILAGSLLTPLNGLITDFLLAKYGNEPGGKSLTMLPATLCCSLMMALVNVPLLFHSEAAIYAAAVLFLIAKPLFLSTPAIFMSIVPPMQYYGVVFGILNVAGGVASFMVYPYLMWAAAVHSFIPVTLLILASSILAFSFPIMLYYNRCVEVRRKEKSRQQKAKCTNKPQQNTTELKQKTIKPQQNTTMMRQNTPKLQCNITEEHNTTNLQHNTTELQQNTTDLQQNTTELQQNTTELQQNELSNSSPK